jgi:glycosyltransferase involved in cell wall biosynthesis
MGILLKRLRLVNHVVYYCLDYYPSRSLTNRVFIRLDKFCFENSDFVWDLSSWIWRARRNTFKESLKAQNDLIVPVLYPAKLLTLKPLNEIDRWSIAFVGTLIEMQGLQLLIEAMPEILKHLPKVHVKIVGDGPYSNELKRLVSEASLDDHFIFYGFVRRDLDVVEIISSCAIGIAPFIPAPENNAITADPGKMKFYTFLGLPVIVTKIPSGLLIDKKGAGIAIEYNPHELANAVIKILQDDQILANYRENANKFARSYTMEEAFSPALEKTLEYFRGSTSIGVPSVKNRCTQDFNSIPPRTEGL